MASGPVCFFFFKQKTAYEMDGYWSSDVCSSDLERGRSLAKPGNRDFDPLIAVEGGAILWKNQLRGPNSRRGEEQGEEKQCKGFLAHGCLPNVNQIGRASCRERV